MNTPQDKLTPEQQADILAEAAKLVTVGARYVHYKQLTYKVVGIALREEDHEPCVIYEAEYTPGVTWIRKLSNWVENVEVDGEMVKRFTKIQ